jgi:hypothetical protein
MYGVGNYGEVVVLSFGMVFEKYYRKRYKIFFRRKNADAFARTIKRSRISREDYFEFHESRQELGMKRR